MVQIKLVRRQAEADAVYVLAYEFIDWLHERYPEMGTVIDEYMAHQKFDEQIKDVLIHFTPPKGECLLATHEDKPVGIVMLKDLDNGICEMNRMFVRQTARGLGAGRALVERLIQRAVDMGFRTMVLDALPRHDEAIALYLSMGFQLDERPGAPGTSETDVHMRLDLGIKPT